MTQPHPEPAGHIHRATLAGNCYPSDPAALARNIDRLLGSVECVDGAPLAIIIPPLSYDSPGASATGLRQLREGAYDVAMILATGQAAPMESPVALWPDGAFATPLGLAQVDTEVAQALLSANLRIAPDCAAFAGDTLIEPVVPFVQHLCPGCRIVPLLIGPCAEVSVSDALASALSATLKDRRAVLIAIANPDHADALRINDPFILALETGDPGTARATMTRERNTPDESPILTALGAAKLLGADTVSILQPMVNGRAYRHSEAAVMAWRYQPPDLTPERQRALLNLARDAVSEYVTFNRVPKYESTDPELARRTGAFVTLHHRGELRGCIGHLVADTPLYRAVQEMAIAAATSDPRFPPLDPAELKDLDIEISVLSPMRRVNDVTQIEIGVHGLLISRGGRRGLLLPQVAPEQGWNREKFLEGVCWKAGLPRRSWREGALLYSFTALVFGD
jgi:MEMO1 family protein